MGVESWIARNVARIAVVLFVVLLVIGILGVRSCQSARTAHTQTKLATGQAGASLQSGSDASNTVGNRMDADAVTDRTTQETEHDIRQTEGADAPVAAPLRDAGLGGLCRYAAYRRDPKCVQYAHP